MKYFKSFTLLKTNNYHYTVGYEPRKDELAGIEISEISAPVLNVNLVPMPQVCRSNRRMSAEEKETFFLIDDEIKVA